MLIMICHLIDRCRWPPWPLVNSTCAVLFCSFPSFCTTWYVCRRRPLFHQRHINNGISIESTSIRQSAPQSTKRTQDCRRRVCLTTRANVRSFIQSVSQFVHQPVGARAMQWATNGQPSVSASLWLIGLPTHSTQLNSLTHSTGRRRSPQLDRPSEWLMAQTQYS